MTDNKPERRLTTVSEQAFHFAALLKPDGEVLEIDRQALRFWGLRPEDVKGKRIWEIGWRLAHDEDASRLQAAIDSGAAGRMLRGESAVWDTDQQATLLSFSLRPVKDRRGKVVLLVANARSLSRHQRAATIEPRAAARGSSEAGPPDDLARAALEQLDRGVILTDALGRIEFANATAAAMLSLSRQDMAGEMVTSVLQSAGADAAPLSAYLSEVGAPHGTSHQQTIELPRDGELQTLQLACSRTASAAGGNVIILRQQGTTAARIPHDTLTGLATRAVMVSALEELLPCTPPASHCFCFLDLDAFQQVEEQYGHDVANGILAAVAQELKEHARRGDLLARLGGDAFGLLLRDCTVDNARAVCDALLRTVQDAHPAGAAIDAPQPSASIGLVPLSAATTPTGLLQLAKHACTRAKEAGGNRLEVADTGAAGNRRRKRRPTLQTQRLRLFAQPLAALGDGTPAPAEVLLRISDKAGRLGAPAGFIANADRADLVAELDRWVIAQICSRDANRPGDTSPGYSINLSAASVRDPVVPAFISEQCNRHGVSPSRLCFELSETVVRSEPRALDFMQEMRAAGFAIALDDYGTTGAELAELGALPVDYLKIGGGLIQALAEDPVDGVLVDAINRIGHLKGMRTVAKWVEDDAALSRVRNLHLDYAQGFAVAEPRRLA